jgi:hypothetical protein
MTATAQALEEIERRRLLALADADVEAAMICWHTDCYRRRDGRWQVVWSQATRIESGL